LWKASKTEEELPLATSASAVEVGGQKAKIMQIDYHEQSRHPGASLASKSVQSLTRVRWRVLVVNTAGVVHCWCRS